MSKNNLLLSAWIIPSCGSNIGCFVYGEFLDIIAISFSELDLIVSVLIGLELISLVLIG